MLLRFFRLRYSPLSIRLAYILFLLNDKAVKENDIINQYILRGGFKGKEQFFDHCVKISGKSYSEIVDKFGWPDKLKWLFKRSYYSGGHGAIEQEQKMHLGLVPKPNQELKTLTINKFGLRNTSYDFIDDNSNSNTKVCLFLGNSTGFGLGATSDKNTIPGRLGYYLNKYSDNKTRYKVINYSINSFSSLQELIAFLQSSFKTDLVVSLSGWNEVDQALVNKSKVATNAKLCDLRANKRTFSRWLRKLLNKFIIFKVWKRFVSAYLAYDAT